MEHIVSLHFPLEMSASRPFNVILLIYELVIHSALILKTPIQNDKDWD